MNSVRCEKCGAINDVKNSFCSECGSDSLNTFEQDKSNTFNNNKSLNL